MRYIILFLLAINIAFSQNHMVITIDDLPYTYSGKLAKSVRDSILIKITDTLSAKSAIATGFVIGKNIDTNSINLITYFTSKGNTIANHTFSHYSANKVDADLFCNDIAKCSEIISNMDNYDPFFRYPMLHTGNTEVKRDSITNYLSAEKLIIAPVTLDNDEYLYNKYYVDSIASGNFAAADSIADEYLRYMSALCKKAIADSNPSSNYPNTQILLLHANLINSKYLGQLLDILKADSWQFISLEEAAKNVPPENTESTISD
jgi:peptidoglycan/xylan/chitin deacetylase (PgdA/CDA1 family)